MATKNRDEQQVNGKNNQDFKEILSPKEDDIAIKDKMYRLTYEALEGDTVNVDIDLIDECVKTIALLDEREMVSEEKIEVMRKKVDEKYLQWNKKEKKRFLNTKILTRVAACLIIIFMTSNVIANVFGYNILKLVMQWSEETFHLGGNTEDVEGSHNNIEQGIIAGEIYNNMDEALKKVEDKPMIPKKIPKGFSFEYAEKISVSNFTMLIFHYINEDREIIVELSIYDNNSTPRNSLLEKDDTPVEIYKKNGVDHYIMKNNDKIQVIWNYFNTIYAISGDITVEETELMIDSIYEGG